MCKTQISSNETNEGQQHSFSWTAFTHVSSREDEKLLAIQQLLGLALWQQHACDGTLKNTTMFGFLINKMDGSSGHHHHQRSEIMMGSIISLAARCWLWRPWSLARWSLGLELRSCGPRPSLPPPYQTQHVSRPASSATFSLHALHAQN